MIEIFVASTPLNAISYSPVGFNFLFLIIGYWLLFKLFQENDKDNKTEKRKKMFMALLLIIVLLNTYNVLKDISFNNNVKNIVAVDNEYLRVGTSYLLYKRISKNDIKEINVELKNDLCHFEIKYEEFAAIKTIRFDTKKEDVSHIKECSIDNNKKMVDQIPL